ncbi:acyl carrier protein [Ancylobacter tetraedralis]|nr:acyl carrier protein [Ancylobacter tetraedralis]
MNFDAGVVEAMDVIPQLRKFLETESAAASSASTVLPDDDLLELGLIDSLTLLKLVSFLEQSFGISVFDEDLIKENFSTMNNIQIFITNKIENKGQS